MKTKYLFLVVQSDMVNDTIVSELQCPRYYPFFHMTQIHYGKECVKYLGIRDRKDNHQLVVDAMFKIQQAVEPIPWYSVLEMFEKRYLDMVTQAVDMSIFRMTDIQIMDAFIQRISTMESMKRTRVVKVFVQDGHYRLNSDKYDYIISPSDIGEVFRGIVDKELKLCTK